jgi:NDP-sugar pyrophosphorylase family protein
MVTAFVLAAGQGTRLRPLTLHRPKPLVPVCGVPMLSYALALVARHGHRRVLVNAHWLGEQIVAWRGRREGVDVEVNLEAPEILGTGGGLRAVASALAPRVVVVNADVLTDLDLTALADAVPTGGAALALRRHAADAARFGVVARDGEGVITRLSSVAATTPVGAEEDDTHFTGLHALDRDVLALVPPTGEQCIVRTAYRALVPERRLRGVVHPGLWWDVGDPAAYLAANLAVLCTDVPVPLDPFARAAFARGPRGGVGRAPAGVRVSGSAWVGAGARFGDGVALTDSVVGDGAVVPDHARLVRCVVWDGAIVPPGEHVDAVIYGRDVLPIRA